MKKAIYFLITEEHNLIKHFSHREFAILAS